MIDSENKTLGEAAKRNPAICPDKVRQMQAVVKHLQDRGLLKPTKYGIVSGLGGFHGQQVVTHKVMNNLVFDSCLNETNE